MGTSARHRLNRRIGTASAGATSQGKASPAATPSTTGSIVRQTVCSERGGTTRSQIERPRPASARSGRGDGARCRSRSDGSAGRRSSSPTPSATGRRSGDARPALTSNTWAKSAASLDAERPSTLGARRVLQPQVLTKPAGDPPPDASATPAAGTWSAVVHPPDDHRRQRGRASSTPGPRSGSLDERHVQTGQVAQVVVHEAVGGRPHLAGLVADRERSTVDEHELVARAPTARSRRRHRADRAISSKSVRWTELGLGMGAEHERGGNVPSSVVRRHLPRRAGATWS